MQASIPGAGPDPASRDFKATLHRSILELERNIHDLLDSSWEEPERRRAYEMAVALTDACRCARLRDLASVVRATSSILRLRADDILGIQDALREKVLDLVDLLKETRDGRTRSA